MMKSLLLLHNRGEVFFLFTGRQKRFYHTYSTTTTMTSEKIVRALQNGATHRFQYRQGTEAISETLFQRILNIQQQRLFSSVTSSSLLCQTRTGQILQNLRKQTCRTISKTITVSSSSIDDPSLKIPEVVPLPSPTSQQLRRVFYRSALPMIGFGIMDQTVMLHAGHAIDCTLGVTFGLSTLTAAAFGQVCSDASGVMFGTTLEQLASRVGLPRSGLTSEQLALPIVQRVKFLGALLGVIFGCMIGLLNLLIIDTDKSSTLKLRAFNEEQEFEFLVEASNAVRKDATALTVSGPDVDGILASMTAALALRGCSLVELHAKRNVSGLSIAEIEEDKDSKTTPMSGIQDIFYVVDGKTGEPYEDDELHDLAESLLDATRTPMNAIGIKSVIHELEKHNHMLKQRVHRLEEVVKEKQIRIVPKSSSSTLSNDTSNDDDGTYRVNQQIKSR